MQIDLSKLEEGVCIEGASLFHLREITGAANAPAIQREWQTDCGVGNRSRLLF